MSDMDIKGDVGQEFIYFEWTSSWRKRDWDSE